MLQKIGICCTTTWILQKVHLFDALSLVHGYLILNRKIWYGLAQLSLTLHYIVEQYFFFVSFTFMFSFYFLGFVADELPVSIIIVYNF